MSVAGVLLCNPCRVESVGRERPRSHYAGEDLGLMLSLTLSEFTTGGRPCCSDQHGVQWRGQSCRVLREPSRDGPAVSQSSSSAPSRGRGVYDVRDTDMSAVCLPHSMSVGLRILLTCNKLTVWGQLRQRKPPHTFMTGSRACGGECARANMLILTHVQHANCTVRRPPTRS